MRRILPTLLALLLALPATQAATQTPIATPDQFLLPVNHLVLRIMEGNGFAYLRDDGVLVNGSEYHVVDGEPHRLLTPDVSAAYAGLGVQDLYSAHAFLIREGSGDTAEPPIGITVDMRLATFRDADAAAHFVASYQETLETLAAEHPTGSQHIAAIDEPAEHDEAVAGITGMDPYYATAHHPGLWLPFARFIAQDGTAVASAKVISPDPAFNDAVARQLLAAQLACLDANDVCVPVPLPADVPYEPQPPVTNPAAVIGQETSRRARRFRERKGRSRRPSKAIASVGSRR